MMIHILFALILFLSSFSLFAETEVHAITPTINYSFEQDATPGYGLSYQYSFKQNIELDLGFQNSNNLNIQLQESELVGNYQSFLFGANFIKLFNNKLNVKIGGGGSYILTSSNDYLVEKNSLSPYLKMALDYKVSDSLSIVVGQTSQFNKGELDSDHQLTLGLRWVFSSNKRNSSNLPSHKSMVKPNHYPPIQQTELAKNAVAQSTEQNKLQNNVPVMHSTNAQLQSPTWYIQFGAYSSETSAAAALIKLQELTENAIAIKVVLHNNLFRLLSHSHQSKSSAKKTLLQLKTSYTLDGFVSHLLLPQ